MSKVTNSARLIFVSVGTNNNKFYYLDLHDDDTVRIRYGRYIENSGGELQTQSDTTQPGGERLFNSKLREKNRQRLQAATRSRRQHLDGCGRQKRRIGADRARPNPHPIARSQGANRLPLRAEHPQHHEQFGHQIQRGDGPVFHRVGPDYTRRHLGWALAALENQRQSGRGHLGRHRLSRFGQPVPDHRAARLWPQTPPTRKNSSPTTPKSKSNWASSIRSKPA